MIKIENKPVGPDPFKLELKTALNGLKVGQSFVIDMKYRESARGFISRIEGEFKTQTEGGQLRIGRVA